MKKHKGKNIKKIAMVSFGMFALVLLSTLPNLIKAADTNKFGTKTALRSSIGGIISLANADDETFKTSNGTVLKSTEGEEFVYRFATTSTNKKISVFAIGPAINEKIYKANNQYKEADIDDEALNACVGAIINQYYASSGNKVGESLYNKNDTNANRQYYLAQKALNAAFDAKTLKAYVEDYNEQHKDGAAKADVKLDNLKYNNKEITGSDTYMWECVSAYIKADPNGVRLHQIYDKFGDKSEEVVTKGVVSELYKTTTEDFIKVDMSAEYGSGLGNSNGKNYLAAQEFNSGSLFGYVLKKDNKDTKYKYAYISRATADDGSKRYNDFQAGVCYYEDAKSSGCDKVFTDQGYSNYEPLEPGAEYEMDITLGGEINTYRTVKYKSINDDNFLIGINTWLNTEEDKVVFRTTFTVPEEDDSGDDDTTKDGIIHVKFIDENGEDLNISGAGGIKIKYELISTGKVDKAETSRSQVSLNYLTIGTYEVTITDVPDGYKIPSSQTVKLTTSAKEKTITFTIKKSTSTTDDGLIKITYYVGNKGIADGEFKAIDISTNETAGSCVTDSNGYCEIADLPIGTYKVTADSQLDGYTTAKTSVGKTYVTLYIAANSKQQTATFYSDKVDQSKGTITVDYSVTSDEKIAGGVFYLYKNGVNTDECITNSLGECKFSNLEYGQYKVVLHEIPENYKETSQEKTVSISQDEPNITVQFKSSLKETLVKFNVVNANKKTEHIKGVKLVVKDSSGQPVWTLTSEGKEMVISDIKEPGTYTVEIEEVPDGYVKGDKPFTLKVVEYQENEVTITVTPTTKVPDTFANASKIFIAAGLIGIIAGTYLVYTNAKKREEV